MKNKKAKIAFHVDIDDIPIETALILRKKINIIDNMREIISNIESDLINHKVSLNSLEKLEECREILYDIDLGIEDASSILRGLINISGDMDEVD